MSKQKNKVRKDSFFNLHFTSTISISLVLFLVGIITLLIIGANYFSQQTRENITLSVILNDDIDSTSQVRLEKYLGATYYVKESTYISREQALKEHTEAMGEDPSEFLGFNPLHASMELKLKANYSHPDSIAHIETKIKAFQGVKEIIYQKDMLQMLTHNIQRVSFILAGITLLLLFISIVLINNTIRISIYSKRFLIHTMTLVGAKPSFIRRPFVKQSICNGLIASAIAIALLAGSGYYVQQQIGSSFNLFQLDIVIPVVVVVIVISILLSWLATVFAVNRYLRMSSQKLFYI